PCGRTDSRANRSTFPGIAADRSADRPDESPSDRAAGYLASPLRCWHRLHSHRRVESGLLLSPTEAGSFVLGLLFQALTLTWVNDRSLRLRHAWQRERHGEAESANEKTSKRREAFSRVFHAVLRPRYSGIVKCRFLQMTRPE